MSNRSLGSTIQPRARILLKALLDYDPETDRDRFQGILRASLKKKQGSGGGYDPSQKLTFDVYSLSNKTGRRVEATLYSLAKLTGIVGERELTDKHIEDAIRCLEQFDIIEYSGVQGKTKLTLTLKYKDKREILARFEKKCQDWNAQKEAKSSKDPWTRVRYFVPPEFDLLDQTFFQKRQGGESRILKLPSAAKNWSLITQDSYIERDQQGEVLGLAEELAKYSGISLLLIRGEPGAGKTAVMQWLAYKLSTTSQKRVLQTKKEDLYWLERLEVFSEQIEKQHFYLIADDLFRDASILDELDRNELQFPLTLIGTTRLNEDQQDKLGMGKYRIEYLDLELSPSPESQEKERILERIRQQDPEAKARLDQKTPAELEKLMAAPSMLVLMLQLSEGKPFDLIIADIIKRLPSEEDYPVYQIFGVICSFYQYGIFTPAGVLPSCLPEYSKKAVRDVVDFARDAELKGLVNTISKGGYEGLATIHELIAQTAMSVKYPRSPGENLPYSCNSLEDHLRAAIQALDASEETHKRWVYHGLRLLAINGKAALVRQVISDYPDQIQFLQQGGRISDWSHLAKMYEAAGLLAERDRCLNAILSTEPQSSWEWEYGLSLIERLGTNQQKQEAISQTSTWLEAHPENWLVRRQYIVLVEKQGTLEQKQKEIAQTTTWLQQHSEDYHVRTQYLALIEQCGTTQQKQQAIAQTDTWLQQHSKDTYVRTKYLALIEQYGTPEQKKQAIAQTTTWLQQHPEDHHVRYKYLALIGHCGTTQQKQQAIGAQTTAWLQQHPEDVSVRTQYLALIGQCGTQEQKEQAIAQTDTWLQKHPEDVSVRENYLALIRQCGTPEQKQEAITQTVRWLQNHTDDTNVRTQYLALIGQYGTIQQQREAIAQTAIWLAHYPNYSTVREIYLAVVGKAGKDIIDVESIISQQWQWISQQLRVEQSLWEAFLPVLYHHAQPQLIQEAVNLALKQYPENTSIICLVFAYFRDELDYETCYQLADFIRQSRLPTNKWQNFIHAANFFRDYGELDTAEWMYRRILKAAKLRASKHGNDMQKTIKFATLSYARLLLLRNPPDPYTAINHLGPILAENPKHCVAHWYIAHCYQAKGRKLYPQAINHFEKAIEFDQQKNGHFWYDFGCFYRDAMENPTEARKCFENSLNQKINLSACVDLAEIEVQDGNFERARESLQQGLALVPITRPEKEQREKLEPRIQQLQAQLGLWEVG